MMIIRYAAGRRGIFFFLPGKNIDEAWNVMFCFCNAVRKMPLSFDGNDFSITITIGIEENDFQSSVERIFERADKKLYMGKAAGRSRVVMYFSKNIDAF